MKINKLIHRKSLFTTLQLNKHRTQTKQRNEGEKEHIKQITQKTHNCAQKCSTQGGRYVCLFIIVVFKIKYMSNLNFNQISIKANWGLLTGSVQTMKMLIFQSQNDFSILINVMRENALLLIISVYQCIISPAARNEQDQILITHDDVKVSSFNLLINFFAILP